MTWHAFVCASQITMFFFFFFFFVVVVVVVAIYMRQLAPRARKVTLRCQDGSFFSFPVGDCAMLPIAHSTSEELSAYIWQTIIDR